MNSHIISEQTLIDLFQNSGQVQYSKNLSITGSSSTHPWRNSFPCKNIYRITVASTFSFNHIVEFITDTWWLMLGYCVNGWRKCYKVFIATLQRNGTVKRSDLKSSMRNAIKRHWDVHSVLVRQIINWCFFHLYFVLSLKFLNLLTSG